jgi:hypothetical protein
VIAWLRERGFGLLGAYNMAFDHAGRAVQADFLFGRWKWSWGRFFAALRMTRRGGEVVVGKILRCAQNDKGFRCHFSVVILRAWPEGSRRCGLPQREILRCAQPV